MRRDHDNRTADGPGPNDDQDGIYASATSRRTRRRKQAMAGAVGLVAILGAGAFGAQQLLQDSGTGTSHAGALTPLQPPATLPSPAASGTTASTAASPSGSATLPPGAGKAGTPKPSSLADRIANARAANAKAGTEVRHPLPARTATSKSGVKVTTFGSVNEDRSTLRVMSARRDLSGQRELAWAADAGTQVGSARCTQNFRFAAGTPAAEKPTLLVCWRLSDTKSVYTVAVNVDGRPSAEASVAAIDTAWSKL